MTVGNCKLGEYELMENIDPGTPHGNVQVEIPVYGVSWDCFWFADEIDLDIGDDPDYYVLSAHYPFGQSALSAAYADFDEDDILYTTFK